MPFRTRIDSIRHAHQIPLPLSKSRDFIAQLLYGRNYSAAAAAADAGVLQDAPANTHRIATLTEKYGNWVNGMALEIQGPLGSLLPVDLFEICKLAYQRESRSNKRQVAPAIVGPGSLSIELTFALDDVEARIDELNPDALHLLQALMVTGRQGGDLNYLRSFAKGEFPESGGYAADKTDLHVFLINGLKLIGPPGQQVLHHFPEMLQWTRIK